MLLPATGRRRPIAAHTRRHLLSHILPFGPRALQKAKVLRAGVLAREPEAAHIRTEILMLLDRHAGGPVGVAAGGPRGGAPAGVHEGDGVGDVGRAEHVAEDGEDLGLCGGVVLGLGDEGFGGDDGDEEEAGAGEEGRVGERLPQRIVAAFERRGVEEVFGVVGPELRRRGEVELQEDFGVDAHVELGDGGLLPGGERRVEGHGGEAGQGVLQYAEGEGADGVLGLDAGVVAGLRDDAVVGITDVGDDGVETEASVVGLEEGVGLADDERVEAALVKDVVVFFGPLVEGCVLAWSAVCIKGRNRCDERSRRCQRARSSDRESMRPPSPSPFGKAS